MAADARSMFQYRENSDTHLQVSVASNAQENGDAIIYGLETATEYA